MTVALPLPAHNQEHDAGQFYIIDAIAPFFLPHCFAGGTVVNWSKIPFALLERDGSIPQSSCDRIIRRFETYARRVAELGFNALSIDDLAHLVTFDSYPRRLRFKLDHYHTLYERIFTIARINGLRVFINTDAGFALNGETAKAEWAIDFLIMACRHLFEGFPGLAGIIVRLGECDGIDVSGEMQSHLSIRTPSQARRLVKKLTELVEERKRLLIVRTWSVGAYPIGDLIWNTATYRRVFDGIASPHLIVSHKYGDTDFFRYVALNPLIFEGEQRKLVEFQTRREYEGFGEFPSFVGYDYERCRDELDRCKNLAGIHVWCQTGGWTRFHKTTFLSGSSIWNEINTSVTLALFKKRSSAEQGVVDFCTNRFPSASPETLLELLRLSDRIMQGLWYLPEFSRTVLYFRRMRVPPLLWVFWDTILISRALRRLARRVVKHREEAIAEGFSLLPLVDAMKGYAAALGLATAGFDLLRDTLEIVALAREYFLGNNPRDLEQRIKDGVAAYRDKYPEGFSVHCDFSPLPFGKYAIGLFFTIILRSGQRYRLIDRLFVNPFAGPLLTMVLRWVNRRLPAFARDRAMGIEGLLK